MHITTILKNNQPAISYELFPPKTPQGAESLLQNIHSLMSIHPSYISVTYGAGGSTRELTHDLVVKVQKETNVPVIAHLTCVLSEPTEIKSILQHYSDNKISTIMALRGDPPKGLTFIPGHNHFAHAIDLVHFIKRHFPNMGIGVAGFPEGHPECPNRLQEINYLKAKVDAGADYICSQLFFDNHDFFDFKERCEIAGITIPIIAGLMPIQSRTQLERISNLALGSRIPAALMRQIIKAQDADIAKIGIDWAISQTNELIRNKVSGIHFYTLNKAETTCRIYESIQGL